MCTVLCAIQVLIVGHVPPGVFGRGSGVSWMRPAFNERFVGLLRQYHSVIVAAIFGHEHTDAFRVVYDDGKSPHALSVDVDFLFFLHFLTMHTIAKGYSVCLSVCLSITVRTQCA